MFALAESNSLVADLDIVVVDAGPHVIEGGSGDVAETDVTIPFTITLPFTVTITYPQPITITLPASVTITMTEVVD
ncbi:MAG TPA: hypothetical protein VE826_07465 [Dongiaceae bacterium]|nr:hypothetical protein [Dongiaceae bacterium]